MYALLCCSSLFVVLAGIANPHVYAGVIMSNLFVFGPSFLTIGSHFSAQTATNTTIALLTNETNTPGSLLVPLPDLLALYGGCLLIALCGFVLFWFFGMDKSYQGSFYKSVFLFFYRKYAPSVRVLTYMRLLMWSCRYCTYRSQTLKKCQGLIHVLDLDGNDMCGKFGAHKNLYTRCVRFFSGSIHAWHSTLLTLLPLSL